MGSVRAIDSSEHLRDNYVHSQLLLLEERMRSLCVQEMIESDRVDWKYINNVIGWGPKGMPRTKRETLMSIADILERITGMHWHPARREDAEKVMGALRAISEGKAVLVPIEAVDPKVLAELDNDLPWDEFV